MGAHHHADFVLDERYQLTSKARTRLFTSMGAGIVLFVIGLAFLFMGSSDHSDHKAATTETSTHASKPEVHTEDAIAAAAATGNGAIDAITEKANGKAENIKAVAEKEAETEHHYKPTARLFANLWLNNIFFTGIAIIGVFFVAVQYVAWAGWSAGLKRVPEAFGAWLPFAGVLLIGTFLLGSHDLFHWTHAELYDKASPEYDAVLDGKTWYLSTTSVLIRMVLFFVLWIVLHRAIVSLGRKEDLLTDKHDVTLYNRIIVLSAIFIIIFAVSSPIAAWDWVMSIDPHWFSTMFGWYMFASWWVSGLATITLAIILLKEKGYLTNVNENHLHDLGKFMFAFSIFWTYLWFSQFMLIYYANFSEETIYFYTRMYGYDGHYSILFFFNIFINFVFPFLFLMTRESKRIVIFLKIGACAILIGHWLDFYLMIMPGTVGGHSNFGALEFGTLLIYASAFILVVSTALTKAPLVAKNHPMLGESLNHHV